MSWTECRLVRLVFLIACHLDDDERMSTALVNLTNQTQLFKCLLRFSINTANTFKDIGEYTDYKILPVRPLARVRTVLVTKRGPEYLENLYILSARPGSKSKRDLFIPYAQSGGH